MTRKWKLVAKILNCHPCGMIFVHNAHRIFSCWQNTIANLPRGTHAHCMVTLANGDLFFMGGTSNRQYFKESYRYIKHDNRWEKKSDMSIGRVLAGRSCARVVNPKTGKEEVVVAGGYGDGGALSSTEIYTVENDTWRQGQPLPKAFHSHVFLPYEDTVLSLGGNNGTSCLDSIYQVG